MRKIVLAGLAAFLLVFAAGCGARTATPVSAPGDQAAEESYEADLFAMDTYMTFKAQGPDAQKAVGQAMGKVQEIEKALSAVDDASEIGSINASSGQPVEVSQETWNIVRDAQALSEETDGAFDITVYPLVLAWGFTTEDYHVPDQSRIDSLLPLVGSGHVHLDQEAASVRLDPGTQIDLGGIAKGYAGRQAAAVLRQAGITSALLNMGGNVQTVGQKPDGSAWRVAIRDPYDEDAYAGYVDVVDKAVVTSGGYERYFEENGHTWHHIIDPQTGYPAENGLISTTVVGQDGEICDALSTALFVMGPDKARAFLENHEEIGAVLITSDRKVYVSPGLEEPFTPMGSYSLAR